MKMNKIKFLLILFISIAFFSSYSVAQAGISYNPQIPSLSGGTISFENNTEALGEYIKKIYNYFIGIVSIVATIVMMIGGFQWVSAGGNISKVEEAKSWIFGSISGLALALGSYMILSLISPNLVNFKVSTIKVIHPMGCCEKAGKDLGQTSLEGCNKKGGAWKGPGTTWSDKQKKCITNDESIAEYLKNDACKGYPIASTLGSDPKVSGPGCADKCRPLAVDDSKSFWYGAYNDIYCCTCVNTANPDYCVGKPDNTLCNLGAGLCKGGVCIEP